MVEREPRLDEAQLRALCEVLGDTSRGLTGGQIGKLLAEAGIDEAPVDAAPPGLYRIGASKRDRLFAALANQQLRDSQANRVLGFVKLVLSPVRWVSKAEALEELRTRTNLVLAFCGYKVLANGSMSRVDRAKTVSEARERANALRAKLEARNVHPEVLRFCRPEIVAENYFHVVLEACKSIADRVREKSGLPSDGATLVDAAFGGVDSGLPLLAFNSLGDDSLKSEHKGLAMLLKGVFGAFRNPTAHAPKLSWPLSEVDALHTLSIVSLIHRLLDAAVSTRPNAAPPTS